MRGLGKGGRPNEIRKEVSFTGKLTGILSSRDLTPGSAWRGLGCWGRLAEHLLPYFFFFFFFEAQSLAVLPGLGRRSSGSGFLQPG